MRKKPKSVGRLLTKALTIEQVESLLDSLGPRAILETIECSRKKADSDISDTVKAVLKPSKTLKSGKRATRRKASDQKIIEQWNDLWDRWDAVVANVGDEEGPYSVQEHHWEEPYFDGSAVAKDLEPVATDMLVMIDTVFNLIGEPELFSDAIEELSDAIKSYPEWMGADHGDGCGLEDKMSRCILRWLWLASGTVAHPGAEFLKKVETFERNNPTVGLDRDTLVDFCLGFPEPVRRDLFEEFSHGRFREEQEKTFSPWNEIAHELERRYDTGKYLARCGRDIENNWHMGMPLIDTAIAKKDWAGAEQWLTRTFAAYQHRSSGPQWFPESDLLASTSFYWRDRSDTGLAANMLGKWSLVSEETGNIERAIASRFQATVMRGPENLDRIIEELKALRSRNVHPSLERLFNQWQDLVAKQSLEMYSEERHFTDTWIHWAIAARTNGNVEGFWKKLDAWLGSMMRGGGDFIKSWKLLACLTNDLSGTVLSRSRFPGLYSVALERFRSPSTLDDTRRSLVRNLCSSETPVTVLAIWKKQSFHIIPEPSGSGGDYRNPVAWAKALFEINPGDYERLIKRWKNVHHRRRNLWSALEKAKLPGCEKV